MKQIFFGVAFAALMLSCKNHGNVENQTDIRYAYDYKCILIERVAIGRYSPQYFFILRSVEDSMCVFQYKVDLNKYVARNTGDTVHFDYINLNRLKNK